MTTADVYRALWRHKLVILALTALLVGAVAWVTSRQQRVYQASTLVRIQQLVTDPAQVYGALATGATLAQTYADIVTTTTIAEGIQKHLGDRTPLTAISGHVSADPVQDLALLWVRASSNDPAQARSIANAAPAALEAFIASTGTPREHVTVLEPATLPQHPISPSMKKNIAFALFAGLILNGGLALLAHALRDPVGDSEEFERLTGLAVLATVPQLRFSAVRDS